jgi:K+-transporting ATPase A subunit
MKNMGNADRIVRVLVALLIGILYFTGVLSGTVAIILLILATIFILTSLVSTCPLYLPFGISTRKKEVAIITC